MQATLAMTSATSTLQVDSSGIVDYWTAITNITELAMAVAGVCFLLWAISKFDDWWVRREQRRKTHQMHAILDEADSDRHRLAAERMIRMRETRGWHG